MSRQITQPVNQVRLTNVAVVRMNKHGKRFEIACYRNKIINYRQGTETDLSEVLQTDRVFTNVSKGQFANKSDLQKAFQTKDEESICKIILLEGQVQISDLEREAQYENMSREIATMICTKCVNPTSCRPYTQLQIRNAMKDAEFVVHPTKNVKQQFLDCVKLLKKKGVIEIERAKMELGVFLLLLSDEDHDITDLLHDKRNECIKQLREAGVTHFAKEEEQKQHQLETQIIFQIDPSLYRAVDSTMKDIINKNERVNLTIRLEIIKQVVTMEGDAQMDHEIERKEKVKIIDHEVSQQRIQQQQQQSKEESDADGANEDGIAATTRDIENVAIVSDDEVDKNSDTDDLENSMSAKNKKKKKNRAAAAAAAAAAADATTSTRQSNKKATKKSKKAKRREKEEAMERTERKETEQKRLEERRKLQQRTEIDDDDNNDDAITAAETTNTSNNSAETKSCNTCGGTFESQAQYRLHFRSDWHRYNVKLKMKGCAPVSEREFLLCDSDAFFESF
mmetsp:Transcript_15078/g.22108  ORF Transcript_15078/g.22108 Transcript_15078/m.22108 type:complete len:509 (-) Transcript_15078:520-2046(-)